MSRITKTIGLMSAACVLGLVQAEPTLHGTGTEAASGTTAAKTNRTAALSCDEVLSIRDGQFFLNGKPFAEINFNKFDLCWQLYDELAANRPLDATNPMVRAQDKALRQLHELGFQSIRIFALPWGPEGPASYANPQKRPLLYAALDKTLELCDAHDIRVVWSLGAGTFTDTKLDPAKGWVLGEEQERELVANSASRSRQLLYRYVDETVSRYRQRRAVLLWEITNELTLDADIGDANRIFQGQRMPSLREVARFFDDVARRIKAVDPLRLVTSGGSNMRESQWHLHLRQGWQADTLEEQFKCFELLYAKSAIDVIDIHSYPDNKPGYALAREGGKPVWLNDQGYMQIAQRLGKPLLIGELGLHAFAKSERKVWAETPNYFESYDDTAAAKPWVMKTLDDVVAAGVPLTYWWCYQSDRADDKLNRQRFDLEFDRNPDLMACFVEANKRLKARILPQKEASATPRPFLHPLFADHLVLQRDVTTSVWGWTQPGQVVKVSLAGTSPAGVADAQGKWLVKLPALPAGGPYTLTVSGPQTAVVRDVLLGDVWLCSGQSNMQMPVSGALNAQGEIAAAIHPRIRFFHVPWAGLRPGGPQVMQTEPQETVAAQWSVCSLETVPGFSAVGYFFARELQKSVDVPIGLIQAAVGGSSIISWCAPSTLQGLPELKPGLESLATLRTLVRENKIGEAYFNQVVEQWWQDNDPGTREGWFQPECDFCAWLRYETAAAGVAHSAPTNFAGIVWFRKEIQVPADWVGRELSLYRTGIWEPDTTWFNGTLVGAFDQGWINRTSKIPAGLVKAGRNVIAVRVLAQPGRDYQGPSAASKLALASGHAAAIPLDGERFLRASTPAAKLPPFPHRLDNDFQLPTVLFNGMIAPLIPFALKGTLWYQGETPCPGGQPVHRRLLTEMIADWRSRFASPESWFLIVQLPVLGGPPTLNPAVTGAADIRAVQWDVGHKVSHADTAVITDLGDPGNIHPKNKQEVGKRLALIAQARIFRQPVEYSGPTYQSAMVEGDTVRVRFEHLGSGLVVRGDNLEGFAVAGADRKWMWADAQIDGYDVLVRSPLVSEPRYLRYDYVDVPRFRLWNQAGLPAAPFDAKLAESH